MMAEATGGEHGFDHVVVCRFEHFALMTCSSGCATLYVSPTSTGTRFVGRKVSGAGGLWPRELCGLMRL